MIDSRGRFAALLPAGGAVLDVGCWSYGFWKLCQDRGFTTLVHSGVDREEPPGPRPVGYELKQADLARQPLPFPSGAFDGVFASHVLEHIANPLALMDEIFRVLKPHGHVYVECPSERSLWLPSMPFAFDESRSLSFFDDPTHVGRPQTPQSLHRMFRMYGADVIEARHLTSGRVRLTLPWLLAKALWRKDAAMLEQVVWRAVGFAVYGIARGTGVAERRYLLP